MRGPAYRRADRWRPDGEALALAAGLATAAPLEEAGEEAPTAEVFAWLEAVHRLSFGVPGAWTDEQAVRRLARTLHPRAVCAGGSAFLSAKLYLEFMLFPPKTGRWVRAEPAQRHLIRLTGEGLIEHYTWRPEVLPLLGDR